MQFELSRLIIMLTVPLSMTGALAALNFTGGTLNVYSQIGLVTLVGLITKHGILIVEFANQLREQGRSIAEAVAEAPRRCALRPILMTTGAMVLRGDSARAGKRRRRRAGSRSAGDRRRDAAGHLLTLFVVPTVHPAGESRACQRTGA